MDDTKEVFAMLMAFFVGCALEFWFGVILPQQYGFPAWNIEGMVKATGMWLGLH